MEEEIKLEIIKGGPLKVHGSVTLIDAEGNETKTKKTAFFCRCGQSESQPFCDGTHKDCGFEK